MEWIQLYDKDHKPTIEEINAFIDTAIWDTFQTMMISEYHVSMAIEFSNCSLARGWNIKMKRANKTLCIVYPAFHKFQVLLTISSKFIVELNNFSKNSCKEMQNLYEETPFFNGTKWLMVDVSTKDLLLDVLKLVKIKAKK